jgi:hypothetical protein
VLSKHIEAEGEKVLIISAKWRNIAYNELLGAF